MEKEYKIIKDEFGNGYIMKWKEKGKDDRFWKYIWKCGTLKEPRIWRTERQAKRFIGA